MMRRISITGVDGTGKTTLIRELKHMGPGVRSFRAPQYHEDAEIPFAKLSSEIDALSELADRIGDAQLKTCALFLSMTLYGSAEAHYATAFRPQILFAERQALADSLAYSKFYKGLLKGPIEAAEIPGLERIQLWLDQVMRRLPTEFFLRWEGLRFRDLPLFIRDLFEMEPVTLVAHLRALYRCEPPDEIILLKVSPERLLERLALKARAGQQREMHEKGPILEALQAGLEQCCQALAAMSPGLRLHVIDTSELSLEESLLRCLQAVGWTEPLFSAGQGLPANRAAEQPHAEGRAF